MVSNPGARYRFHATPQSAGRLIESSLMLWLASWRPTLWPSLLYGVASALPLLTFGDLGSRMMQAGIGTLLATAAPWWPGNPGANDPMEIIDAMAAWLRAPSTWALVIASLLLVFASITLVVHRQARIGTGQARGPDATWRAALARVPAATGAWLLYSAIVVVFALPIAALTVLIFWLALGAMMESLPLLLVIYLFGALVLSVPLAWISVAAGFSPFASTIDADGPIAAQWRSLERVRGHWTHAAVVFTVPLLVYLGIGSAVSSLLLVACGGVAFAMGGWPALIAGQWLAWSQLLAAIPMAIAFPLAFAGGVVGWHDLGLRAAAQATAARAG